MDRKVGRPKEIICKFIAVAPPSQMKAPYFRLCSADFKIVVLF